MTVTFELWLHFRADLSGSCGSLQNLLCFSDSWSSSSLHDTLLGSHHGRGRYLPTPRPPPAPSAVLLGPLLTVLSEPSRRFPPFLCARPVWRSPGRGAAGAAFRYGPDVWHSRAARPLSLWGLGGFKPPLSPLGAEPVLRIRLTCFHGSKQPL